MIRRHWLKILLLGFGGAVIVWVGLLFVAGSALDGLFPYGEANPGDSDPAWSPDSRRIAFAREGEDGLRRIHVVDVDGTALRQLTSGDDDEYAPSWSPDGRKIAYTTSFLGDIDVIGSDGSSRSPLIDGDAYESRASWESDGRLIMVVGESPIDTPVLWSVDLDTGERQRLATDVDDEHSPSWQPHGTSVAFGKPGGIYVTGGRDAKPRLVVAEGYSPTWSPDGRRIAFLNGEGAIFVVDVAGTNRVRLPLPDPVGPDAVAWSPDGRLLSFAQDGVLYVMNADGSGVRRLLR